jgi:hypothetical protein
VGDSVGREGWWSLAVATRGRLHSGVSRRRTSVGPAEKFSIFDN